MAPDAPASGGITPRTILLQLLAPEISLDDPVASVIRDLRSYMRDGAGEADPYFQLAWATRHFCRAKLSQDHAMRLLGSRATLDGIAPSRATHIIHQIYASNGEV